MNLESEKRLSMEELKQRNLPHSLQQEQSTPKVAPASTIQEVIEITPQSTETPVPVLADQHPTQEEWSELLTALASLDRRTAAQAALVRELSQQASTHPTREQIAALARDAAAIRSLLEQAGKKNEQRFSLRLPRLPHPHLPRPSSALLLIPVIALVLWAARSSWGTLWSAIRMLLP